MINVELSRKDSSFPTRWEFRALYSGIFPLYGAANKGGAGAEGHPEPESTPFRTRSRSTKKRIGANELKDSA